MLTPKERGRERESVRHDSRTPEVRTKVERVRPQGVETVPLRPAVDSVRVVGSGHRGVWFVLVLRGTLESDNCTTRPILHNSTVVSPIPHQILALLIAVRESFAPLQ